MAMAMAMTRDAKGSEGRRGVSAGTVASSLLYISAQVEWQSRH